MSSGAAMRAFFLFVLFVGVVLIVATPLLALNLLKIWPVQIFYGAGIVIYLVLIALYVRWRRRSDPAPA
jgi:type III secretory pathway component EscR